MDEGRAELLKLIKNYSIGLCLIRFVHGGVKFVHPVQITGENISELEDLQEMAPLHNSSSLELCRLLQEISPDLKLIAVFDTEYFHFLPQVSQLYGLSRDLTEKYNIRRYGFHGFAHSAMSKSWEEISHVTRGSENDSRLITLQLGSGCSMAAIKNGQPIDTTMGFTPNDGLLMSTRCGEIDPGLVTWLQRKEGWTSEETDYYLNEQSGWFGLSAESKDMAEVISSKSNGASMALSLFIHRIHKNLGAYFALLGGLDGIVLSGGIAEHAMPFCRRILANLGHLGIEMSADGDFCQAVNIKGMDAYCLSIPDSRVSCWSVKGSEHLAMMDSVARSPDAIRDNKKNKID
tara:strand:- start:80423 stop:81463 length:1041 start_codon:yes stop_codon:yes gene_type:complete